MSAQKTGELHWYYHHVAIAFSGGKDSTATVTLVAHLIATGHLHPCKLRISAQPCAKGCNNEVSPRYSCFNQCIESLTDDAGKLWSHLTHIVARLLILPPTRYEEDT